MRKVLSRFALLVTAFALQATVTSCSDDDENEVTPNFEPPTFYIHVNEVQRTEANFTVSSSKAADYAYIITEAGSVEEYTAEDIFENGTVGVLENGAAKVTTLDVEGGKKYEVYVAVRRINPYVYSEVTKFDIDTDMPYVNLVTLDRIGMTDFKYHIEFPDGATSVKHIVVKKTDYEAIKSILAMFGEVTYETYLKVFGQAISETTDVAIDKFGNFGYSTTFDVHTNTPFILMAGVPLEDGNIDPERFQAIEFTTRPAGVCHHDIQVSIETTSTTATISLTPDEGITDYRVLVDKKSEYDYWRREGEAQMRSVVIGHWDDSTNPIQHSYTGDAVINPTGMIPETDYVIGIVGFDSERNECVKYIDFRTGEPVGPKPEITIAEDPEGITAPWKSAAYNVKIQNAVSAIYGYFPKAQVDNVLANGSTMSAIIQNNGAYATGDQIAAMLTSEGLTLEAAGLSANTEYVFGVYAVNDEYVSSSAYVTFTTEPLPQLGGEVRTNMPGHYTASTTDASGNTVTFPVTITTGVDDVTTADYALANRLVALGFGPASEFPYQSPSDLISAGKTSEEAIQLYGPKWFIEFREDGIVVPKPDGLNWTMGNFGTSANSYFWGVGIRPSTGRDIDNLYDFPIEVSADGNTVTVKGYYNANIPAYYYPTMCTATSQWFISDIQFRCYSDIVLTRDESASTYAHRGALKVPRMITINSFDRSVKEARQKAADILKK